MATTVLNRFEQTPGPLGDRDNRLVLEGSVESGSGISLKQQLLSQPLADINTAGNFVIAPGFAGTMVRLTVTSRNAITLANVTAVSINGTPVTGGSIDMGGAAASEARSVTPTAANTFAATETFEIAIAGNAEAISEGGVVIAVIPT